MDPNKPSCWDGYKATGTKMKDGRQVPDCKKEDVAYENRQLLTNLRSIKIQMNLINHIIRDLGQQG